MAYLEASAALNINIDRIFEMLSNKIYQLNKTRLTSISNSNNRVSVLSFNPTNYDNNHTYFFSTKYIIIYFPQILGWGEIINFFSFFYQDKLILNIFWVLIPKIAFIFAENQYSACYHMHQVGQNT